MPSSECSRAASLTAADPGDPAVPAPDDPQLRKMAIEQNLIGPNTAGMTLGYGIFIVDGCLTSRLLAHECRHVYQYEVAGSIDAFLPLYLEQIAQFTYDRAPFEMDARAWEWVGVLKVGAADFSSSDALSSCAPADSGGE